MAKEAFKPNRRVRQGDAFSLCIFVLCMERLSHTINVEVQKGSWKPIAFGNEKFPLSHLLFADDLILFAEVNTTQVDVITRTLDLFCKSSGHSISKGKSILYCSPNVEPALAESLSSTMGIKLVGSLGRYLGTPLTHGSVQKYTFDELLIKSRTRTATWDAHKISMAGRLTLIQSILAAIPLHLIQFVYLSKEIVDAIDNTRRSFLWGANHREKKMHLVKWEDVCRPKNRGGLGIRKLRDANISFILKLAWGLSTDDDCLWKSVFRAKYGFPSDTLLQGLHFRNRKCFRSRELWRSCRINLPLAFWEEANWYKWISSDLSSFYTQDSQTDWPITLGIVYWRIWNARNEAVLGDQQVGEAELKATTHAIIKEVKRTNLIFARKHHQPSLSWLSPSYGWLKLNTDGAVNCFSLAAAAGGVIRSHDGE